MEAIFSFLGIVVASLISVSLFLAQKRVDRKKEDLRLKKIRNYLKVILIREMTEAIKRQINNIKDLILQVEEANRSFELKLERGLDSRSYDWIKKDDLYAIIFTGKNEQEEINLLVRLERSYNFLAVFGGRDWKNFQEEFSRFQEELYKVKSAFESFARQNDLDSLADLVNESKSWSEVKKHLLSTVINGKNETINVKLNFFVSEIENYLKSLPDFKGSLDRFVERFIEIKNDLEFIESHLK